MFTTISRLTFESVDLLLTQYSQSTNVNLWFIVFCHLSLSYYAVHKVAHLFGGSFLHLRGDMGVGVKGESGGVMPEHAGESFSIDAVLNHGGRKCVTQIVKSNAGFQACTSQQFLVRSTDVIGVIHAPVTGEGNM